MRQIAGRSIGLTVLVSIMLLQAFAFLADALNFVGWLAPRSPVTTGLRSLGVPFAFAGVIAAVLLVHRAYMLWTFHWGAWRATLGLFFLKAGFGLLDFASGNPVQGGISVLLPAMGIVLLLNPDIRRQFSEHEAAAKSSSRP